MELIYIMENRKNIIYRGNQLKEQEYILENQESFNLEHIFECGQCFRWNKNSDGSYTGVIQAGVIKVTKIENKIIFKGKCSDKLELIVRDYFDLNNNYLEIKEKLAKIDDFMKISTEFGDGIRILHQDLWECIISFIISANNNIPRIKKIIEKISEKYGNEIEFEGKKYYIFPTPEQLSKASVEDLRKLGLGFRDKRVYETTKKVVKNEFDLEELKKSDDANYIEEQLLTLDGVGTKVASCIMLFSLKKYDVFPIDVWVRRVMNELYIHNENEEKVSKKIINDLAKEKFLGMAGLAQQYLFYWKRENA